MYVVVKMLQITTISNLLVCLPMGLDVRYQLRFYQVNFMFNTYVIEILFFVFHGSNWLKEGPNYMYNVPYLLTLGHKDVFKGVLFGLIFPKCLLFLSHWA